MRSNVYNKIKFYISITKNHYLDVEYLNIML